MTDRRRIHYRLAEVWATACGRTVLGRLLVSHEWKDVTCERCLSSKERVEYS